ncbi:hypothetical protein MCUN1_000285 [Malassezia cuniculi]|uniref:non-specific serine/threonine protein kinase n=1 Tax=Malassezia cuniculi TaxID=948313 RepID=A0AAF0EV25_9BASI|nr:hypothetical protein MCUN1_000285 [Malassezia cuniculi]
MESACALLDLLGDDAKTVPVKQGAEARVYRAPLYTSAGTTHYVLLKHRFLKRYRHPALSAAITASRTTSEARTLVRCARAGVRVPRVEFVDETRGILGLEWIDGPSVRQWLGGIPEEGETQVAAENAPTDEEQLRVMDAVGTVLADMHCADVIHGDLTTSNMMLRPDGDSHQLVLIDFGLSSMSTFWEDKAVDLYVLEPSVPPRIGCICCTDKRIDA